MKINLTQEGDIQILTIKEEITSKDTRVLKAGIGKLFKNGKNKIILELTEDQSIPNEVLRELAALDVLARELSGRILLAGVSADTHKKIELFAIPPVIPCYLTRAEAINAIKEAQRTTDAAKDEKATKSPEPQPAIEAPKTQAAAPTPAPAPSTGETDEATLAKIAKLEEENNTLKEQVRAMTILRREPPDKSAYTSRISELENQLEEISNQIQAAKK